MTDDQRVMTQTAPYPHALADLVEACEYRPGWTVRLYGNGYDRGQGSKGMTLVITANVEDSVGGAYTGVKRGDPIRVGHLFVVPAASYNRDSWQRWLLDRFLDVEQHEACEFFRIGGERVFAPHHSEGEDPYIIWQIGDPETARKRSTDK